MQFFLKATLLENHQPSKAPVDEIVTLYEDTMKSMESELKISPDVLNSFKLKDTLNPDVWTDDKLNPDVRKNLIKIANDFVKTLELPEIKLKDILFVGSLANYNWSKFSDIDLHLVVDFSKFKEDQDFIKSFFDAHKNLYNLKHDIEIAGHPIEVYFQDTKEKLAASAIYSVRNNKWVLKPEKTKFKLDKPLVKRKVEQFFEDLRKVKKNYDNGLWQKVFDESDSIKEAIKKMRKAGLEKGGEFSTENIVFKILRRTNAMELLDNYKYKAYDQLMTIIDE